MITISIETGFSACIVMRRLLEECPISIRKQVRATHRCISGLSSNLLRIIAGTAQVSNIGSRIIPFPGCNGTAQLHRATGFADIHPHGRGC